MSMRMVNCMKHRADLQRPDGSVVTLEPSGNIALCREVQTPGDLFEGFPTVHTKLGAVEGLPDPQEGTVYYVNRLVFSAAVAAGRTDVVTGDSGSTAVRWTSQDAENGLCPPKLVGLVRFITHLVRP